MNFKEIGSDLLSQSSSLVPSWLPGGKLKGKEWVCGSIAGEPGESLKVNLQTGKWADFATGEKGGDLISLYAAIHRLKQNEAALALGGESVLLPPPTLLKKSKLTLVPPPENEPDPDMKHFKFGEPTLKHCYHDKEGRVLFWIARYDPPGDKKQFLPWSWDGELKKWVNKAWEEPRPLFNLPDLHNHKDAVVIIVEGEKAAFHVKRMLGDKKTFVVTTWPGGAQAWAKADWTPLVGRKILIWPDADTAGIKAADGITKHLKELAVKELKRIQVSANGGWDAADAASEGWDWKQVAAWAKERVETVDLKIHASVANVQVINNYAAPSESIPAIPETIAQKYDLCGIYTNERGKPILNASVILQIFQKWPPLKGFIWYDEFHDKFFTEWSGPRREWNEDLEPLKLLVYLQSEFNLENLYISTVREALSVHASHDIRNEPADWVKTLQWDGLDRISDFFTLFFGVEKSEYTQAVSRNFWVGMMARIFQPGCQVDEMVILEGAQGTRKSGGLEAIGGKWHTLANGAVDSKDFLQCFPGKLIVEIAELESFSRAEDKAIKRVLTTRIDRYRASYARSAKDYPRRCIFVGTTNEVGYLKDVTGGRRFWPLKTDYIDRDLILEQRDQLFAEAYQRYLRGDTWYEVPKNLALYEQESRREVDEWENKISAFLKLKNKVQLMEIASEVFGIQSGDFTSQHQKRIARALRALKWTRYDQWLDGRSQKYWKPEDN
jgi:predicted P-loop ATPase